MRKLVPLIIVLVLGAVVGLVHNLAEEIAVSTVVSCSYNNQDCALSEVLVPVVGFPFFSLGMDGPDLKRALIINSVIWALTASAIGWFVFRALAKHRPKVGSDVDGT